jgi:hypothetical protein
MPTDNSPVANSFATADKDLDNLSVLCGILSGGIERARRDLRQIRSESAAAQSRAEKGQASELSADMLGARPG